MGTPDREDSKPGKPGKDSGYKERQPASGEDARNSGKRPHQTPEDGGLERDPEADADRKPD